MKKEIEMRQEGKMQKKIELFSAFVVLLFVLCVFMPIACAQTTQAEKDKTNSTLVVRTLTYNDFDELNSVCTYDNNWCGYATKSGKAVIYGYMRKMNITIPEDATTLVVTIHICGNGWGEGLAGPNNSSAHIIVDDEAKEERINSSMPYHDEHNAYYKYEYGETFANTFNISRKNNVTLTIKMNNDARLDFQKAVLSFIGEEKQLPPIKGVCYGPFRDGQNPDQGIFPSETDIREDMPILKNMAEAIRTYGVCNGLEKIVPIANEFDLKVSPGAWICSNYEGNEEEINNLTSLAQNYEVETVIVGNEVVLRYENGGDTLTEAELVDYVTRVRENVSVPVTTGEPWHIWDTHPDLVNAVDHILIHIHPYWDGVSVNNAANYAVERYEQIQNKYPHKEVVIGETGWPSEGLPNGEAVPSVENQKYFMEEFLKLANEKGISFYYFEAFDEKWKVEPNGVGPHWGFYNSSRKAKHSIDSVLPHVFYFDTGKGGYPSIMGTHTGNITPNHDIIVTKMYTCTCPGTGGHSEYVKFWNESWHVTANWTGYKVDLHNITFDEPFTLYDRITYNYTIRTGSYPQIHHNRTLPVPDGVITCTEFIDANGKRYNNWIPAIMLE